MSKKKEAVLWIRITYRDTTQARERVLKAADALFRKADVTSRGDFTEEEVIGMVKEAMEKASAQAAAGASTCTTQSAAPLADEEDPLAGEEFEE